MISFFLSACFTLGLVVGQLLISPHGQRNPLDQALQNAIMPKAFRIKHRLLLEKWAAAIDTGILAFSDIQLITSLAILICGYLQLSCGISLYHWQTVVNLAWFSSVTHLTTLTSLRQYFRRRPFMATCRVFSMVGLLILLSAAFVPTGYLWQEDQENYSHYETRYRAHAYTNLVSSPATCLFKRKSRSDLFDQLRVLSPDYFEDYQAFSLEYNTPIVVLSLAYLITSYLIRVIRISAPLSQFFGLWLERVPMVYLQSCYQMAKHGPRLQNHKIMRRYISAMLLLFITLAEAIYEAGDSMIWEILWLSAALVWGTLRSVGLRIQTHVSDENRWGFGQTLPLVLSILPIWCLLSTSCCAGQTLSAESASSCKIQNTTCPSTFRRIKRTTWFRVLTILITGTASNLAAYLLFDLAGTAVTLSGVTEGMSEGLDYLQYGPKFIWKLKKYVLALAFCAIILIIFVCICLIVRWRTHRSLQNHSVGEGRPKIRNVRIQRAIRYGFWLSVTFSLLALEVTFIITMLISPAWLNSVG